MINIHAVIYVYWCTSNMLLTSGKAASFKPYEVPRECTHVYVVYSVRGYCFCSLCLLRTHAGDRPGRKGFSYVHALIVRVTLHCVEDFKSAHVPYAIRCVCV